jgi:hypothetical protein
MRIGFAVAAVLAVVLPLPAMAQSGVSPTLTVGDPLINEATGIPLAPASTPMLVTWTYDFGDPVSAAAVLANGNVSIAWSLQCGETGLQLLGEATTPVTYVAGQGSYSGTANLAIAASEDSLGDVPLDCTLRADAPGAADVSDARAEVLFHPRVAFVGHIELGVPVSIRQAGPQKQIPFEVEVRNVGNAPTEVRFEVLEPRSGKWIFLAPEPLLLGREDTATAIFVVSTPYQNGPNKDSATVTLRAVPVSTLDEDIQGPAADAHFLPRVRGWYIPGASPLVLLVGLAAAALVSRRR